MALVYSQRSKRAGCCLFQVLALHACTTFSLLSDTAAASVESVTTADVWTSSRENVTIVRSAEELKRAVQSGVPHIELQEHIFFTSPALNYLGIVPDTVKSIRVRSTPPCLVPPGLPLIACVQCTAASLYNHDCSDVNCSFYKTES